MRFRSASVASARVEINCGGRWRVLSRCMWSVLSSRRSRPGRQAKNGDGSTSRRLRPTQILLLFQSLDGGNQGFVATGDDTLQLGTRDGAPQWMFLDVFEDGPAARAGVRPGHHLISVDGTPAILLA